MLYRTFHDISRDPLLAKGADNTWSPLLLALRVSYCISLQFSPDCTRLLVSGNDTIHIYDATTGAVVLGPIPGGQCCFSTDGLLVISESKRSLHVWDSQSGAQVMEPLCLTSAISGVDGYDNGLAVSSDGALIACGSDHIIEVWNAKSGLQSFTAKGPDSSESESTRAIYISCLAFSPDSTRIISGFSIGAIASWECSTGAEICPALHGHTGSVLSFHVTSDGMQMLSIGEDSFIQVWDVLSGTSLRTIFVQGLNGAIKRATFSADGRQVLIGTADQFTADQFLELWDTFSGVQTRVIAHDLGRRALALAPNGKLAASANADFISLHDTSTNGTINVSHNMWDTASTPSPALSYSPDGTRIALAAKERRLLK
jgi:WD40 repeat protein